MAQVSDAQAAHFIPGMRELRALNLSGTSVGPALVEALTYGVRLQHWRAAEAAALAAAQAVEAGAAASTHSGRTPTR